MILGWQSWMRGWNSGWARRMGPVGGRVGVGKRKGGAGVEWRGGAEFGDADDEW